MTTERLMNTSLFTARSGDCLRDAMKQLDATGLGIVLVCESDGKLLDTVTDGDVRRAILDSVDLDAPLWQLYGRKTRNGTPPVTASFASTDRELYCQLIDAKVRHLPLVDENLKLVGLFREAISTSKPRHTKVQAVVMAGGFGTRLRPLTDNIPKPMLQLGGKPLLERIVSRLRECGIHNVNFTTHYLPEQIQEHFGDGSQFGVQINYVSEEQPLGTAGSLNLLVADDRPLVVINGDILTSVDFSALVDFHDEHDADMTVGVRQYELTVPYGVLECDGSKVTGLKEKPKLEFLVNAGIYLIGPEAKKRIPQGERFDMTDLIDKLIAEDRKVVSFPVIEYWLDIGKHEDFEQAQQDIREERWAA